MSALDADFARDAAEAVAARHVQLSPDDLPDDQDFDPLGAGWRQVDLLPYLRGTIKAPEPALLDRSDGIWLLYPHKVHWISGEPEGSKTWFALIAVADALEQGLAAVYIDFEGDATTIVERLQLLGTSFNAMAKRLSYHRPETAMAALDRTHILERCAALQPGISVIDGVQAAMGLGGHDSNNARDFYRWWGDFGIPLHRATPGPTLAIDHVAKDPNTRGQYAAGTIQKQAAIDVHFGVEMIEPFGIGMTGRMTLMLHKDRSGRLRPHQAPGRAIGILTLSSNGQDAVSFAIDPPEGKQATGFRPTILMERVSRYVENAAEPPSKRQIRTGAEGKEKTLELAVDCLYQEDYLRTGSRRGITVYLSSKPYRAAEDPLADAPQQNRSSAPRQAGKGRKVEWCPVVPGGARHQPDGGGAPGAPPPLTGADQGTTTGAAGPLTEKPGAEGTRLQVKGLNGFAPPCPRCGRPLEVNPIRGDYWCEGCYRYASPKEVNA